MPIVTKAKSANATKAAPAKKPAARKPLELAETIVVRSEFKGSPMFGVHLKGTYDEAEPLKSMVVAFGARKALALRRHLRDFKDFCADVLDTAE